MSNSSVFCPTCGRSLPSDSPLGGRCPACMLAAGLASEAAPPATAATGPAAVEGSWTPPSAESLDQQFTQLEVKELIGKGGMGAVYRARQSMLGRDVALKVLSPRISQDPRFGDRFLREARALAQLSHPGIVVVHDFGREGDLLYLVMEYVDGVNLRDAMHAGAMSPAAAMEVVLQVSDALQYAHSAGVVHRDIKPENILMERGGRVRLVDFGLAKLTGVTGDASLTATNQIMGTMHYMAPEQWEHPTEVDHRADIYSLGVVFYELLTGQLPLGRFKLPSEIGVEAGELDRVVLKTLERLPSDRYQNVSEVNDDISRVSRLQPHARDASPVDADVDALNPLPSDTGQFAAGQSAAGQVAAGQVDGGEFVGGPFVSDTRGNGHSSRIITHPGRLVTAAVMLVLGLGLLAHGLLTEHATLWIGMGLGLGSFPFFGMAFTPIKDGQPGPSRSPNPGFLLHGFTMLWSGAVLIPGGYDSGFGWAGMGLMIGGAFVMGVAWERPKPGQTVLPWNRPDWSILPMAIGMIVIGSVLLLAGIFTGNQALPWIGMGLTVGGGSISHAAWMKKNK